MENILYNVPNEAAMDLVPPKVTKPYPTLQVSPEELLEGESLVDLGEAAPTYIQIATEVTASGG